MDDRSTPPSDVARAIMNLPIGRRRLALSAHLSMGREPELAEAERRAALDYNARLVTAVRELAERHGVRAPWSHR